MHLALSLTVLFSALPALDQQNAGPHGSTAIQQPSLAAADQNAGQTAKSSAGRAGDRQTAAQAIGNKPLARINGRIPSRVDSRILNRIDRTYDPPVDASSAILAASRAAAKAGRPDDRSQ